MDPDRTLYRRARTAYELGRGWSALRRAAIVSAFAALLTLLANGHSAMTWLPATILVWTALGFRGGFALRGAWRGLVGGAVLTCAPLAWLRPCCEGMSGATCTAPEACVALGAGFGALVVMAAPRAESTV